MTVKSSERLISSKDAVINTKISKDIFMNVLQDQSDLEQQAEFRMTLLSHITQQEHGIITKTTKTKIKERSNSVTTPQQLNEWAKSNISDIKIFITIRKTKAQNTEWN